MPRLIHILEPTLVDSRGHGRSLVQRVSDAAFDCDLRAWVGKGAPDDLISGNHVQVQPWFHRRIRMPQLFVLAQRLLRQEGVVAMLTAGRTDLTILDRAMGRTPPHRSFAYVHWLRPTPSRMRTLSAVATRRPDLRLGAATESVCDHLAECGFRNITLVPYPMAHSTTDATGSSFRHVLFAGAARQDKGFHHVVDIVARWSHAGRDVPLTAQVGGDYFGRMDSAVRGDLTRLEGLDYPHLSPAPGGLDPTPYAAQFRGALCLQLYDPVAFQDRASGVTLDAFLAGAPVIAWKGTWISRQIERFGAGLTVPEGDLASVIDSVDTIINDYPTYADAARRAGTVLADAHDPRHLFDAIVGDNPAH